MIKKLNLTEKLLCNSVGKMFEKASEQLSCYETSFCKEWLQSDLCKSLIDMDETLICQSATYLFNSFKKDLSLPFHAGYQMNAKSMYWVGYLFTYWMLSDEIDGYKIVKIYDIKSILEQYDVLHTLSINAAISTIKKDYRIGTVLLDSVLHSDK